MRPLKLAGRIFGKLTVLFRTRKGSYWRVRCACGVEKEVYGGHLTSGRQRSCGCGRRLTRTPVRREELALGEGRVARISPADAKQLQSHFWHLDASGYPCTTIDGRKVRLHTLLNGPWTDHINGDKLDNRRSNLRTVTPTQSAWNAARRGTNRSGFKGVDRYRDSRWRARIRAHGRITFLGYFKTAEEAARAYDAAARKQHGEFARLNFP